MYKPDGDSIYVTLGLMEWGWNGNAVASGGEWEGGGHYWGGTGEPSCNLPIWDDNLMLIDVEQYFDPNEI